MTLDATPICKVDGCEEPCQIVSKKGDVKTYMKTCRRHDFTNLPGEKEKLETFWPPENS